MAPQTHIAVALLVRDGRGLLAHRHPGRRWYPNVWDLVGGHVEPGETPEQAVRRECVEEIGVTVGALHPLPITLPSTTVRVHAFLVTEWTGDPANLAPDEHDDLAWFTPEQMANLALADASYLPHLVEAIRDAAQPADSARRAYASRAREYADLFGTIAVMSPADRQLIEGWAGAVEGTILDAGCGPGHWTAHLAALGHDVEGMDPVDEFVEIARAAHPQVPYRVASFADLTSAPHEYGGILAWYSMIHLPPADLADTLEILHAALAPGGRLLLGFFDGPDVAPFDHAVTPAHFWPTSHLQSLMEAAGFTVDHVEQRTDPGRRPHAALAATRR